MVLRIFWNAGAGLVHRALNKHRMKPGLALHYPAVWRARTGFLDCDVNLHLNNASYLYATELARWHYTASSGILFQALKNRRIFIAGSQAIRYRHAIPPFHAYEIQSKIIYWDDAWIYFQHQFLCLATGKVYAESLCRVTVLQGKTRVTGAQMVAEVEKDTIPNLPEEMPDSVREYLKWDAASRVSMETSQAHLKADAASSKASLSLWEQLKRSMNLPF